MLPSAHRMHRSSDFASVVRSGDRIGTRRLVLHHLAHGVASPALAAGGPASVGFVVSKAVGGSVVRHRVSRRLRAVMASRLESLPAGSATVVRALPPAARSSSAELAADLDRALSRRRGDRA